MSQWTLVCLIKPTQHIGTIFSHAIQNRFSETTACYLCWWWWLLQDSIVRAAFEGAAHLVLERSVRLWLVSGELDTPFSWPSKAFPWNRNKPPESLQKTQTPNFLEILQQEELVSGEVVCASRFAVKLAQVCRTVCTDSVSMPLYWLLDWHCCPDCFNPVIGKAPDPTSSTVKASWRTEEGCYMFGWVTDLGNYNTRSIRT